MRRTAFYYLFRANLLPRWLRRKLKKLKGPLFKARTAVQVSLASVVLVVAGGLYQGENQALGQTTVDIGNHRTVSGYSAGSSATWDGSDYSGGVRGTEGSYVQTGNWFGYSATNNVITHLNSLATSGGTVNISQLDVDTTTRTAYPGGSGTSQSLTFTYRGYQAAGGASNASNPGTPGNHAHTSAWGGTVTVGGGLTTSLTSSVSGQLFTISDNVTKAGTGTLNIQTNTAISSVTGNAGTLRISGTDGKIATSGNVDLNGGNGSGGGTITMPADVGGTQTSNHNTRSNFTFESAGTSNTWAISGNLDGNGFNNDGYMTVGGNATLDNTTAITGTLGVTGTTTVGGVTGTNNLNIKGSGARLTSGGMFTAGTVSGSTTYVNVMDGGNLTTSAGASLATATGSNVTATVSNATWTNTGQHLSVGNTGTGTLNIFSGVNGVYNGNSSNAGVVNSGTVTVAENANSTGNINMVGSGTQLNVTGAMVVAKGESSDGNMKVYDGAVATVGGGMTIAEQANSDGDVTVSGTGAKLAVTGTINMATATGADARMDILSGGTTTASGDVIVAKADNSIGLVNVTGTNSLLDIEGNMVVAQGANSTGTVNISAGGGTEVALDFTIAQSANSVGTVNVWGAGSYLDVDGDMVTAAAGNSHGNLYIWQGATSTIGGDHTIAEGANSLGRVYVDGTGSRMDVGGTLTVGQSGYAGGTYTENRYDGRYKDDPAVWFNDPARTADHNFTASDAQNVVDGSNTGNDPGLAITRGAVVTSGDGMVGENAGSYGYVLIDDKGNASSTRTQWYVDGDMTIADEGEAFVRVLNGALLEITGNTIVANSDTEGTLHVIGTGADGTPSEWINHGYTIVGNDSDTRGTVRINDGAHGVTHGLYIGLLAGSEGEVSVKGEGSLLEVYEDTSGMAGSTPQGSSLLSVSDLATVWMHENSELRLNGNAVFSNGAMLHLDEGSIIDTMNSRATFTNARVEGVGTVTGEDGVHFRQDDYYTEEQAYIDPGLAYGWNLRCEDPLYYGTLTFGHTLSTTGNVITNFDINSWGDQDHIVVQGDPNNTTDAVTAQLGGTLRVHARMTDYYDKDVSFTAVTTVGANGYVGTITDVYDTLEIMPYRFFENIGQSIVQNGSGDDTLVINLERKDNPFEEAGETHNQKSTGVALDSIYALQLQEWLPVLRYFWYLEDPDFLNAYTLFSGEIRAHSLLMPLSNPWTYANDRVSFSRKTGHVLFGAQHRSFGRERAHGLWGTAIYNKTETDSDGNAAGYELSRTGFVVGHDRSFQGGYGYTGIMFAYSHADLESYRSEAKADDFQFGIYHGRNLWDTFEWKNYLGFGWQNYNMRRDMELNLSYMVPDGSGGYTCTPYYVDGHMSSNFSGYTLAGSTEIAKPYHFGKCCQWTLRPYIGLDLTGTWQNAASENGNFDNSHLVALDYDSTANIRVYGKTGLGIERGGNNGNIRGGVGYSWLMGGHRYTQVDNKFQIAGDSFSIRGVDDGSGVLTLNVGGNVYLNECKKSMVFLDYWALSGSRSTTHAVQLGWQRNY